MIRSLKILGLMAVAALAMSAMLASAAQADPKGVFTTGIVGANTSEEGTHTASTVTGHQYGPASQNFFEAVPGSEEQTTCEIATFHITEDEDPTPDGTAETLTAKPTYKHCEANGLPATVAMNGCDYTFEQPTKIATNEYTGTSWLHCEEGKAVEITVFLFGSVTSHSVDVCTIKVFPANGVTQTLEGHLIYKNQVAQVTTEPVVEKHDVTANATIDGISWSKSGSCGSESGNEAIYRNTVTVTANDPITGEHHDAWISDEPSEEE